MDLNGGRGLWGVGSAWHATQAVSRVVHPFRCHPAAEAETGGINRELFGSVVWWFHWCFPDVHSTHPMGPRAFFLYIRAPKSHVGGTLRPTYAVFRYMDP